MGILQVKAWGSFRRFERIFNAQGSGHAVVVDDAIAFLKGFADEVRAQDLKLRKHGQAPDDDFAEADKRGLLAPQEGYPPGWKHATIHLNPATGEMHSDGDHSVRQWIDDKIASLKADRADCLAGKCSGASAIAEGSSMWEERAKVAEEKLAGVAQGTREGTALDINGARVYVRAFTERLLEELEKPHDPTAG